MSETAGFQGVCHLLSDAAHQRPLPLKRLEAVQWAVSMAAVVANAIQPVPGDPSEALAAFMRARGVTKFVSERCRLPGTPCETCIATQLIPGGVAVEVVELAGRLGCDAPTAYLWASRVGACVLATPITDRASNPEDALASPVMAEYASDQRQLRCDLAEQGPQLGAALAAL